MKNEIVKSLKQVIKDEFSEKYVDHVELNKVTNSHINADYYCNIAMKLAKELKINPEIIANQILKKIKILDGVNISVAMPGYINFDIDKDIKKILSQTLDDRETYQNVIPKLDMKKVAKRESYERFWGYNKINKEELKNVR